MVLVRYKYGSFMVQTCALRAYILMVQERYCYGTNLYYKVIGDAFIGFYQLSSLCVGVCV